MDRSSSAPAPAATPPRLSRAHLSGWLALGALTIVLIAADAWFYERQRDRTLDRTEQMLGQLAEQKSRELESSIESLRRSLVITTLDEQLSHDLSAAVLSRRALDAAERRRVGERLAVSRTRHGFTAVTLYDSALRPLASAGALPGAGVPLAAMRAAADRSGEPAFGDAEREPSIGDSVEVRVLAPVPGDDAARGRTIGYALFTLNESRDVFARVAWGSIRTGPQYRLLRRAGDEVIFLSDLHADSVPPTYRVPIATPRSAPTGPFRGESSMFNAVDPSGVDVVARAHDVPGTSWVVIAEMDRAVALAPLRDAEWTSIILLGVLATGVAFLTRAILERVEADARTAEADARLDIEISRQRYDFLNRYAQDVIFVLDERAVIVEVSDRCVPVYGIARRDLIGRPVASLRSSAARADFERDFTAITERDGITFETEHQRADGTVFPVEVSARPLSQGGRRYFHAIVRDITERRETEAEIRLQQEILAHLDDGVVLIRAADRRIVYTNPGLDRLFAYAPRELEGQPVTVLNAPGARSPEQLAREISAGLERDRAWEGDVENVTRDGRPLWTHASVVVFDHPKRGRLWIAQHRDITAVREARRRQELAASIFSASTEAMMITDASNRILEVNPAFSRITGYAPDEVAGKTPQLLASGRHPADFYRRMWQEITATGHWEGEIWNRRKNGETSAEWLVVSSVRDPHGELVNYIAQFSDVTEEKRSNEVIWRQANYDSLTQLPNRRLFRDRLEQEIKKAKRAHRSVALLFLDLDRFKEVNDTFGHVVGDRLLVQAAGRIVRSVRDSDTVARLGGDEFTVVIADLDVTGRAERVAENLVKALSQPFLIDEDRVYLSASIGITMYPRDATTAEVLLRNADQAMYGAKREGRGRFNVFSDASTETSSRGRRLSRDLQHVLANEELLLHFQPVVDLKTGEIQKAEAFLRWRHPSLGMIPPSEFIPVAEETGLISDIGDWVIRDALRAAKGFSERAGHTFRVGVNLSPVQLQHRERALSLLRMMREEGFLGGHLLVEITEASLLSDRPEAAETLAAFRAAGVAVAVDDFGTGFSSLDHLNTFHPDFLKIDRSFTHNIGQRSSDLALSEGIIAMAHKFGLRVIAEGIETAEQRELLVRAGCDLGQGFLFSRPLDESHFATLLRNGKPAR